MKKTLTSAIVFLSLAFISMSAHADCSTEPGHPCYEYGCPPACLTDPNNYDPFDVPFDGGVSLIVLGGAALGVFGLKKKKNKQ